MRKWLIGCGVALALAPLHVALADVKIGLLVTLSGPTADVGRDQIDGFTLALEQRQNKLGGQLVSLVTEDDQAKSEVGLLAINKLLDRDKVNVVVGLTYANVLMAVQPRVASSDIPFIGTVSGPSPIAGKACKPNMFVMSWQSDAPAEAVGKYLTDKGVKRVATIAPNFVGGKDKISGLKRFYKGEIVEEVYTPMTQLDFAAELSNIAAANPDAIYAFMPSALGVAFVRQFQQSSMKGKIPLYTTNSIEGSALDAMGNAAVGAIVGDAWAPGHPTEESRRFVEAFKAKYKRTPTGYAAFTYDAAVLLDAAIAAQKGNAADGPGLSRAIKATRFQSVRGNFAFGNNNFPVQDYHIYEIVSRDGKPEVSVKEPKVFANHADSYAGACGMM